VTGDFLEKASPEDRLMWLGAVDLADPAEVENLVRTEGFDWARLLTNARDNRVLVRLADSLMNHPSIPHNLKAALAFYENKVRESVERDRVAFERALPAIVRLNQVILLRGMAHAYTLDRDRPTRLIGTDVDLVIDRPQYPSVSGRFLDHHHIPKDVQALSPPRLEYHHNLNFKSSWCVRLARIDMKELWDRRRVLRIAGQDVGLLAVEDDIVYLSFHNVAKRFVGLYRFVDLVRMIREHDVDWEAVVERAVRYKVGRCVWANLVIVERLSPGLVPAGVLERLEPSGWMRAILRRLFAPELITQDSRRIPGHSLGKLAQAVRRGLLYRVLLVRPGNAAKILVGPINLTLFQLYSGADRTRLLGGMIGRARSVAHRSPTHK
jgi:hypothetical protein